MTEMEQRPVYVAPAPYNPNTDTWEDLTRDAHRVEGHALLGSEACERLEGVPFMITRVYYRDGIGEWAKGHKNDYVSIEAVVAPESVMKRMAARGRVNLDTISVDPGEHVVFNDGSTGVYRQITAYLHSVGAITVDSTQGTLRVGGKSGESAFDQPRSVWTAGADQATEGIPTRLECERGLRFSEYENEFGDAQTFYLG